MGRSKSISKGKFIKISTNLKKQERSPINNLLKKLGKEQMKLTVTRKTEITKNRNK